MIKNGHLSAVFLLRKSQPAVRICQATTLLLRSCSALVDTPKLPTRPQRRIRVPPLQTKVANRNKSP